jgi:hypothetical protein
MDDHRIISAVTEHAHPQKCSASRRPNHHDQVVIHLHSTDRVTDGVLHIGISDCEPARRSAHRQLILSEMSTQVGALLITKGSGGLPPSAG